MHSITFAPDGDSIATASEKTVRIWNVFSGGVTKYEGHEDWVRFLAFNPNGRFLASASADGTVRLWEPEGRESFREAPVTGPVAAIALSPNAIATAVLNNDLSLWSPQLKLVRRLPGQSGEAVQTVAVAISPDGSRLASAGGMRAVRVRKLESPAEDPTVRLWDVASGRGVAVLSGHQDQVRAIGFTPDGSQIVSASVDKTIRVWDAVTGNLLRTLNGQPENPDALAISPDGRLIAAPYSGNSVGLWDRNSGELIRTLSGHNKAITALSFGADGRLLSGSGDKTIRVWDVKSGSTLAVLQGHDSGISSIGWSPDQRRIVSSSGETVLLWDTIHYESVLAFRPGARVSDAAFPGTVICIARFIRTSLASRSSASRTSIQRTVNIGTSPGICRTVGNDWKCRRRERSSGPSANASACHSCENPARICEER